MKRKLTLGKVFVVSQSVKCSCFPTFSISDLKLIEGGRVRIIRLDALMSVDK